eukprot:gene9117-11173_t
MGERKVITKYYPPDFDPSKIPKTKVKKAAFSKVTTMLPMSIRCNTCGEYIGRGTKFNAKKETVQGEDYLGIKIYRFFLRCKRCAAELTIKTDPKNSEYVCESGATKNYEPWKETSEEKEERLSKEKEEQIDAMKALENRTLDSKREMEMLDAIEELKAMSARNAEIDPEQLLEYHLHKQEQQEREMMEEDQRLVQSLYHNFQQQNNNNDNSGEPVIKRISDEDDHQFNSLFSSSNSSKSTKKTTTTQPPPQPSTSKPKASILGRNKIIVKKSNEEEESPKPVPKTITTTIPVTTSTTTTTENVNNLKPTSAISLFSNYASDEDEDEE